MDVRITPTAEGRFPDASASQKNGHTCDVVLYRSKLLTVSLPVFMLSSSTASKTTDK